MNQQPRKRLHTDITAKHGLVTNLYVGEALDGAFFGLKVLTGPLGGETCYEGLPDTGSYVVLAASDFYSCQEEQGLCYWVEEKQVRIGGS